MDKKLERKILKAYDEESFWEVETIIEDILSKGDLSLSTKCCEFCFSQCDELYTVFQKRIKNQETNDLCNPILGHRFTIIDSSLDNESSVYDSDSIKSIIDDTLEKCNSFDDYVACLPFITNFDKDKAIHLMKTRVKDLINDKLLYMDRGFSKTSLLIECSNNIIWELMDDPGSEYSELSEFDKQMYDWSWDIFQQTWKFSKTLDDYYEILVKLKDIGGIDFENEDMNYSENFLEKFVENKLLENLCFEFNKLLNELNFDLIGKEVINQSLHVARFLTVYLDNQKIAKEIYEKCYDWWRNQDDWHDQRLQAYLFVPYDKEMAKSLLEIAMKQAIEDDAETDMEGYFYYDIEMYFDAKWAKELRSITSSSTSFPSYIKFVGLYANYTEEILSHDELKQIINKAEENDVSLSEYILDGYGANEYGEEKYYEECAFVIGYSGSSMFYAEDEKYKTISSCKLDDIKTIPIKDDNNAGLSNVFKINAIETFKGDWRRYELENIMDEKFDKSLLSFTVKDAEYLTDIYYNSKRLENFEDIFDARGKSSRIDIYYFDKDGNEKEIDPDGKLEDF